MSYTNVELVRHHLDIAFPIQSQVYDQAVVLSGSDYVTFFGGTVDEGSVVVKALRDAELTRLTVTFTGTTAVIAASSVVPGSVLIASNSSLGAVYVEGKDYVVDYAGGRVILKQDGSITVGQTVTVWCQQYHVYSAGDDYLLDSSEGALRRSASGDIGDGETVYLDYAPTYSSYKEELLANAVAEANALVERAVDPDRQFGADPALEGAATYRALEIICRASAARELCKLKCSDKAALAWMKLGDCFSLRSEELLASFRPPHQGPAIPATS